MAKSCWLCAYGEASVFYIAFSRCLSSSFSIFHRVSSSSNMAIMPTTSYKDPLTSINLILFCFCFSFTLVHCVFVRVLFFLRQVCRIRFVLRQQIHADKIILFEVTNIPWQNEDSIFFRCYSS